MSSNQNHYAYGSELAAIETVMRFAAVKRWHMIDTTRQQTLAEHSANVAALAYLIAESLTPFFGEPLKVSGTALLHDMTEVFTGDIPSHTKSRLTGVKELEDSVLPRPWKSEMDASTKMLIKLCDLADGIRFIRLHGVDVTAKHAQKGLEAQLVKWMNDAEQIWPEDICRMVNKFVHFYAYEFS